MQGASHFVDIFGPFTTGYHHPPDFGLHQHHQPDPHSSKPPIFSPPRTEPVKHSHPTPYETASRPPPRHHDEEDSVFNDFMRNSGPSDLKVLYENNARRKSEPQPFMQLDKRAYKCEYCGATFSLKIRLDEHVVRHTGTTVYTCDVCESLFPTKEECENHIEIVHSKEKPYKCGICGAGFLYSHDLKVHENVHVYEIPGKDYNKADAQQNHKDKVHDKDQIHTCKVCNTDFPSRDELEAHLQTHDTGLKCTICGASFPNQSKLMQHSYQHVGKKPHICTICDAVFGQKGHLKRHMARKHFKETNLECMLCDATFVLQDEYEKHQKVHASVNNLQCKFCKMHFSSIVTLSMHIAQDHSLEVAEKKSFAANQFNNTNQAKGFGMNQNFMQGSMRGMNDYGQNFGAQNLSRGPQTSWPMGNNAMNSYEGMESGEESRDVGHGNSMGMYNQANQAAAAASKQQFQNIYNQVSRQNANVFPNDQNFQHPGHNQMDDLRNGDISKIAPSGNQPEEGEVTQKTGIKLTGDMDTKAMLSEGECILCGAAFVSKSNLIRHYMNVHNIDTPFYGCSQCPEKFYKKRDLDIHMMIHDGVECDVCGEKFPNEGQLKVHSYTHTGIKPFSCKFCSATFEMKSHLRRHTIQRHLQEKSHACSMCDETFVLKSELKKHEKTHTSGKPAVCDICGASFALIVGLKRHLKIVHTEKRYGDKLPADTSETKADNDDVDKDSDDDGGDVAEGPPKDVNNKEGPEGTAVTAPKRKVSVIEETESANKSAKKNDSGKDAQSNPMTVEQPLPLYNPQGLMWPGRGQEPFTSAAEMNRGYFQDACMYSGGNKTDMARPMGGDQPFNPLSSAGIEGYPFYGSQYFQNQFGNRPPGDGRYPPDAAAAAAFGPGFPGLPMMNQAGLPLNMDKNSQLDPQTKRIIDNMDFKDEDIKSEKKPLEKKFKCECGMMFSSRSHLLRHSAVHTGLRPFACRECDMSFAQKDHLRRHVRCMHAGVKPFRCTICGASFSQKCNLQVHVKVHDCEDIFKCDMCDYISKKESALIKHKDKVHMKKVEKFKCKTCKDEFTDKEEFVKHQLDHNKPQTCNECGSKFPNEAAYLRHSCFHSLEKQYKCDLCTAAFSKHSHLKRHTIQKHIDDNLYICSFCDAGYEKEEDLKEHEEMHAGEKIFSCDVCSVTFKNLDDLKDHREDEHSDEASFTCKFCGDNYSSAAGLKKHEKIHKDTTVYKCDECDEEFAQKVSLAKHKREEHSKKNQYQCETCGMKFTNKAKLRDHSRQHVQEKGYHRMYSCDICNKLIKKKNALIVHKNKMHFADMFLECEACGMKFRREHLLKKHQREVHDIEYVQQNAFQCNLCDLTFRNISGLTIHNRSHKGQRVYVCNYCSKTFNKEEVVAQHVEEEHSDKEYACRVCEMKFSTKSEQESHEKHCSGEEKDEEDEDYGEDGLEDGRGLGVRGGGLGARDGLRGGGGLGAGGGLGDRGRLGDRSGLEVGGGVEDVGVDEDEGEEGNEDSDLEEGQMDDSKEDGEEDAEDADEDAEDEDEGEGED